MDWEDVRIFLFIARSGSVVAAAKLLGIDHSTASRRLSRLEDQLGTRLFDRAGRRLRITAAGQSLRQAAEGMESIALRGAHRFGADEKRLSGRVRIGAPEGLGAGYLGGVLAAAARVFSDLDIELIALPQNYSLASREADIAITLDRPQVGQVFTRKLTDYGLGLYGTAAYREAYGWPDSIADLGEHRVCGYIPELLHTKELDYLRFEDRLLRASPKSTSIVAQLAMIAQGEVIGIVPAFMAKTNPDLIPILASSVQLTRSYWLSVHDDLRGAARVKAISDFLFAAAKRDNTRFRVS